MMNINEPTSRTLQVKKKPKNKNPEPSAITRKLFSSVNTCLFQKRMVLFIWEEDGAIAYFKRMVEKLRKTMYIKHLAPWLIYKITRW